MTRRVALMQSNYLPWRGYFDLMAHSDEFVIYDSCQYTVNDWRNRNRLKTSNGVAWITVPILTKGRTGQLISEAEIVDHSWVRKHRGALSAALGRAPHGAWLVEMLETPYEIAATTTRLSEINLAFLRAVHAGLGLTCAISDDSSYLDAALDDLSPSARVAELTRRAGATHYLTGPSGLDYLEAADFEAREVTIEVLDYSTLKPYPQLFGDFEPAMSVVDLLANVGPEASTHLTSTVRSVSSTAIEST